MTTRFKYVRHSDMCGCDRCATRWDMMENPTPASDRIPMTEEEIYEEDQLNIQYDDYDDRD